MVERRRRVELRRHVEAQVPGIDEELSITAKTYDSAGKLINTTVIK